MNVLAQNAALQPQIRDALAEASSVIALSGALRDRVAALGISTERIIVQRNGVDGARFTLRDRKDARAQLGIARERHLLCFVGNLVPEKGPDVLVEALAHVDPAVLSTLDVVLIGDGPLRRDLEARAERLGVRPRLSFPGRCPPEQVARWLSASDGLCLPSRREGCPNVVLEALASGRPVVAAAVGGVPELLTDQNGIMVAPEDPHALARGIERLFRREWNPSDLRASVGSLTWESSGRTLHRALSTALQPSLLS
jgi:glycosyltransferase involved in cell wall biosynthesis